jgi:phospholipid N-methyltransferase
VAKTISHYRVFFRQFRSSFHTTGAVLPSGQALGRALSRFVRNGQAPKRILEVGPGTGAVTRHIVGLLGPEDRLDLVELNDSFVACLNERFRSEPHFAVKAERCHIIHDNIENLPDRRCYDLIISGLPLNNFAVADVERILDVLCGLLKPGGTLSFFEYIAIRHARSLVCSRDERTRLRGIGRALDRVLTKHEIRRDWILPNLPPAWVHHVRLPDSTPTLPARPATPAGSCR